MRFSPNREIHDPSLRPCTLSPAMRRTLVCAAAAALGGFALNANAQLSFSIDFQGPKGMPSFTIPGLPISEGDILIPPFGTPALGPLPFPGTMFAAGMNPMAAPNLMLPAYGFAPLPPGVPGMVEVDAISYGTDALLRPAPVPAVVWTFSVDEFAAGLPAPAPPSVFSEGAFGAMQAAGDVYRKFPVGPFPPGPVPPFAWPPGNTLLFDGSGTPAPFVAPLPPVPGLLGLGLIEPTPPTPVALPDMGMNLDALDVDNMPTMGVFFSLDTAFPDPLEPGAIVNSGSAAANGFVSGGSVLFKPPGLAPPIVYAPAPMLGLDLIAGPDSDDLDALVLRENGIPGYQPSPAPYSWLAGATDELLFSVRRGSAVIGAPDSIFGIPICEGDILVPPVAGGLSPFPGIFIAAENLGLATMRSTPGAVAFPPFSDELDALDVSPDCNGNGIPDYWDIKWMLAPDCNGNGIPDACDIASGFATDCNCNGIPDSCDIASGVLVDTDGDGIPNKCECPGDVNGSGAVNTADLLIVIAAWGACGGACPADITPAPCGNGVVNTADLLTIIGTWGPCP